jgi:hypothetical protein
MARAEVGTDHDIGVKHGDEGVEVAGAASCEEGIDHGALTGAVALGAGNSAPLTRRRALLASCLCEISSKHAVTVPLGSLAGPVGGDVLAVGAEGVAVAA